MTIDRKPLALCMLERVTSRRPAVTITAPCATVGREYTGVDDDNRVAYMAQSAATRNGRVAPFHLRQKPHLRVKPRVRVIA
ncbi:hypothetical protein EAH88_11710 [Rhodanobacter glycinis]|uniref:Uncharacterized protein n=1 Tax=Rhodanobacter glycinis TaxID=582702 RepID=A0A502C659_9GAMM|nr:hypothetical protein [Rhodanobacter glycinis]TPG08293.1 hypothetical protein EAH88_11710 [Rhodanobacter glycinis]